MSMGNDSDGCFAGPRHPAPLPAGAEPGGELVDRDVLMTRVIDGCASPTDLATLAGLARRDAGIWTELAQMQRESAVLSSAAVTATACADRVDLPSMRLVGTGSQRAGGRVEELEGDAGRSPARGWRLADLAARAHRAGGSRLGWAVAALIALAWVSQVVTPFSPRTPIQSAGWYPASADDALGKYLDMGKQEGRVIRELPERVVMDARPVTIDGQERYEVIYLRQVVERAITDRLYRPTETDTGARALVPASLPSSGAGRVD